MIICVLHVLSIKNVPKIEIRLKRIEILIKSNVEKLKVQINATTNILLKLQNRSIKANTSLVRSRSSSRTYISVITIGIW